MDSPKETRVSEDLESSGDQTKHQASVAPVDSDRSGKVNEPEIQVSPMATEPQPARRRISLDEYRQRSQVREAEAQKMKEIEQAVFSMMTSAGYSHLVKAVSETVNNPMEAITEMTRRMRETIPSSEVNDIVVPALENQDLLLQLGDPLCITALPQPEKNRKHKSAVEQKDEPKGKKRRGTNQDRGVQRSTCAEEIDESEAPCSTAIQQDSKEDELSSVEPTGKSIPNTDQRSHGAEKVKDREAPRSTSVARKPKRHTMPCSGAKVEMTEKSEGKTKRKWKKNTECHSASDKSKEKKDKVEKNVKIPHSTSTEKSEKPSNGNSASSTSDKNVQEAHSKSSTRSKRSTHSKSSAHSTSSGMEEMKKKEETDKKKRKDTHKELNSQDGSSVNNKPRTPPARRSLVLSPNNTAVGLDLTKSTMRQATTHQVAIDLTLPRAATPTTPLGQPALSSRDIDSTVSPCPRPCSCRCHCTCGACCPCRCRCNTFN